MTKIKISAAVFFLSVFFISAANADPPANKITIAVPDFKNISKNRGYDFLEKTVAESLTTSLQKSGKFNIVERQYLMTIMDEKKLALSGLADVDINGGKKIGQLVRAEELILGSISSAGDKVEINARLVNVDTGEVILAEKITENMGDKLFDRINDLADEIVLRLTGEKTGFLDFDSTPQGSEVKIGDSVLGNTPITGKKMKIGKYTATLSMEKFGIKTVNFEIKENEKTSLNIALEQKQEKVFENFITAQSHMVDILGPDYQLDWGVSYERMIGSFSIGFEFGGVMIWHNYSDTNAPGPVFQETMLLYYHRADIIVKYYLFPDTSFITPYAGAGIGFTLIDNTVYEINQTQFYWKGILGACFFPSGRFSFYIEAIYHNMGTMTLNEKRFNPFGDYSLVQKTIPLQNILLGLGFRIGF